MYKTTMQDVRGPRFRLQKSVMGFEMRNFDILANVFDHISGTAYATVWFNTSFCRASLPLSNDTNN